MIIIPAIDIRDGKVVRFIQGEFSRQTVYSDSPVAVAEKWASFGVSLIHVVDLDGALEGRLKNLEIIKNIAKSIKPKIELGGGIRDEESIKKVLDAGIEKVVIGTKALDGKFLGNIAAKYKDRIVAGVDASGGYIHTKGWVLKTRVKAIDLAKKIEGAGIGTINYTDILRDGMLEGPNIVSLKELIAATGLSIVASGGISKIDDIKRLQALKEPRLTGVIIGKALYENRIDLGEAVKVCLQNE